VSADSSQPTIAPNATGSRWYVISYVGNSIRKHKTRFFSLLIGILIAVALVSSVFVWTGTDSRVAAVEYFDKNTYQYSVQQVFESPIDPSFIFDVEYWFSTQVEYQASDIIYQSVGFCNSTNWNSSTPYLPHPYARGIKDFQTFFVDNNFLHRVAPQFEFDGVFELSPGECIISSRVVEDAETILNQTISIGSFINITIASIYREPTTLGDLQAFSSTNLLVVGIYNITQSDTVLYNAAGRTYRSNYPGSIHESIFGWNDGLIMHYDQLTSNQRDTLTTNFLYPILLVQLNPLEVSATGLENVPEAIRSLQFRLQFQYPRRIAVNGEDQVFLLEQYIAASQSRQTMAVITLPVILLSILLTIFATTLFLSGRRSEVAILRARGASFQQLYAAFIFEFMFIGVIALCLGMVLSLVLGSSIPASFGFLQFDPTIFYHYLTYARIDPLISIIAFVTCLIPPLIFTIVHVRTFLRTEIYEAMVGTAPVTEADLSITIIYSIAAGALLSFLIVAVFFIPVTPLLAIVLFVYSVIVWTLFSDIGSRIVRQLIAGITRSFQPLFGEKTFIFEKSMRTRRQRIVPLLLILTLTFSITVFAVVEAQTVQDNVFTQVSYCMGADLRIESGFVHHNHTADVLTIPDVDSATAHIYTTGTIGPVSITIYGIDVESNVITSNWDSTSTVGETPLAVLSTLHNTSNGIILPWTLADQLEKTVGESVVVTVHQQGAGIWGEAAFRIIGLGRSVPGLGYFDPDDPMRSPDPTDGFQFQEPQIFALINSRFLINRNMTNTRLILASVSETANIERVQQRVSNLEFTSAVYSPITYSLEEDYQEGYLFNRGVISLLSIGFLACVIISIITLILFVGIIVTERQTEYAIMRAVGSTQRQISAIVIGEFVGLILASFLVALFLGFFFSWLIMFILLGLSPFPFVIPFHLSVPLLLLLAVLGIILLGISLGTYIPARRAGRTNVGKVLRNL
jgi:ABC-type antimicrobial peptide transport system permease subunit